MVLYGKMSLQYNALYLCVHDVQRSVEVETATVDINIQQLSVTYATRNGSIPALHDLSLTARSGEFVAVIGPSGCGKSTLLRAVGGLIPPTSGTITVGGVAPDIARRQRRISFVFQKPVLLPWRTARQNVEVPLQIAGWTRSRRVETAQRVLQLVGLEAFADAYPHQLSGGMQQRVALARALVLEPAALLLDEPFCALDELSRERLHVELLRIWELTGATVLFVTHALTEAVFLADRVLVLSSSPGTIVTEIPIKLARPRTLALLEQEDFLDYVIQARQALHHGPEEAKALTY